MPVVTTPEALLGRRRPNDAVTFGAPMDHTCSVGMLSKQAFIETVSIVDDAVCKSTFNIAIGIFLLTQFPNAAAQSLWRAPGNCFLVGVLGFLANRAEPQTSFLEVRHELIGIPQNVFPKGFVFVVFWQTHVGTWRLAQSPSCVNPYASAP